MATFNKVILVGNLTRDCELRFLPSGLAVTDCGLAVNDRAKDASGNWIDVPTFIDVTFWGKNAETLDQYTKKGNQIMVEGRLKMDSWQDNEGKKRTKLKVIGERLVLLNNKGGNGGNANGSGGEVEEPAALPVDTPTNGIPF